MPKSLQDNVDRITHLDATLLLRLNLSIDKSMLASDLGWKHEEYNCLIVFFMANLVRFLRIPLLMLDRQLFASPCQPTIVVVTDADVSCATPFLAVTSPSGFEQAQDNLLAESQRHQGMLDRYRKTLPGDLHWTDFALLHLTPLHFLRDERPAESSDIDKILDEKVLHLGIIYTANHSIRQGDGFRVVYASADRIAGFTLETSRQIPDTLETLRSLALWPFEGIGADRLTIFQNAVVRELAGYATQENYSAFVRSLQRMIVEARGHHRLLLHRLVDERFSLIQGIVDWIAEEVSKKIDSMTKGLTDMLLGAVGIVVLTLLASLVNTETPGSIIRFGLWFYAFYLFVFQGLYQLGSIYHSYFLLQIEASRQLRLYSSSLGENTVEELSSPMEKRKQQFWLWYLLTWGGIVLVVLILLGLSFYLPQQLLSPGFTPQPTATLPSVTLTP